MFGGDINYQQLALLEKIFTQQQEQGIFNPFAFIPPTTQINPKDQKVITSKISIDAPKKPYTLNVPLSSLTLISIGDLIEFNVHKGCYLKLKFIQPCTQIVAVQGKV